MLSSKYPDVTSFNSYLNSFSEHKSGLAYSIGHDSRFKFSRSTSCPGPGHYRVDRDYPQNELDDVRAHGRTGFRVPPKYSIPSDSRLAPDGVLKGISLRVSPLGPGQYQMHKLNTRSHEKSFPAYTIPSAKETAEAVRDRKKASDVPGPGVYEIQRYGDELGKEKQKAMERAVRRGTNCWASAQYSHLFAAMKPRGGGGAQLLPPLEAASMRRPAQDLQEQAATA
mmetsp:Transcript_119934/g.334579  ORF Transcript_119934/g.334579 Transcript_119934/m.334579 type:complete len:225 (-) Transcript_119934:204-878(-)